MCVYVGGLSACAHAREYGAPSSGLVAAQSLIPNDPEAGCRDSIRNKGGLQSGDQARCHLFKSSSSAGNKRETWKGDEVAPARTVSALGPEGRGGSGRTLAPRALPAIRAGAEQGRSGAWTLRPQSPHSLDRELEPSGCSGYGLQKFSFVTPCLNCRGCRFFLRSPAGRSEGLCPTLDPFWKDLGSSLK